LELQATYDSDMARRLLRYAVLIHVRYELPVETVVVLLRPEADGPAMQGTYSFTVPRRRRATLTFRFRVLRIWERPAEELLSGGLATLPLTLLANVSRASLPDAVRRMEERIEREAPTRAADLWTAAYLLSGLRYERDFVADLLKGVRALKESTTYQAIIEEGEAIGRIQEARQILLRLGTRRFGNTTPTIEAALNAVLSLEELERLLIRLLEVESWDELLRRD
jgi:predicted transposase YdaD